MSYCPRPKKTAKTNFGAPATKTVNPPAPRAEACAPSSSTVVTGGGTSTSTTVYIPGPAGPAGADGLNGLGFIWRGEFALNYQYKKQDGQTNTLGDVITYEGQTYLCIQDNISVTEENPEYPPDLSPTFWALWAQRGAGSGDGTVGSLGDLFNLGDVFNWFANASVSELIQAGIAGIGIAIAGAAILDALSEDGTGDGTADQRYTGTDGYLLTTYTAPSLPDVLTALCDQAGIASDVTLLPNEPCEFTVGNSTATRSIVQQLALVYGFDMVDTGTALKFVPKSVTPVKTLTFDDMGFGTSGSPNARYVGTRYQGIDLPKTVTLQYFSSDLDYNTFTQTSELFPYTTGQDINLTVPLTLTHEKAKEVAEVALINSHLQRQSFNFTTTYAHIDLEPGDVIETPMGLLRITKINEVNEGLLEMTAVEAGGELAIQGSNLTTVIPPASSNIPAVVGYSQGLFIDPPNLSASDTGIRLYAAVHGYGKAGWPGAQVYVSDDGGASYSVIASAYQESTFGLVATPIAAADWHVWDETTTISVVLKTGSLSSKSEISVLNKSNWCMIGQEIIGFKTATLTAPNTYTLSGLLRGRQGTEQFVGTHVANELFVMLDDALIKIPLTNAEKGSTLKYKVVTVGSSLDKADAIDVYAQSNNTLMWTVYGEKALKIGADYQFSWSERIRFDNKLRDYGVAPRDPDWGGFAVVIYDAPGTSILKSYPTTSQTFTYTAAMQTADFGSPQASIKAAIVQTSQSWGAGYPVIVTA